MSVIPWLFKEDFALTFFESEAKPMFCLTDSKSVLDHIGRIWPLCLLSWAGMEDDVTSISLLVTYGLGSTHVQLDFD